MLPMPDSSMETSHNAWVGRKQAKLKRTTLDCGHANAGEVHYHYWCDRLSCSSECADAPHDCSQFKGKSSSEGEAVEPEAVVDWLSAVLPEQQLTAEQRAMVGNVYGSAPIDPAHHPAHDRVADAFRSEVLRQGLTEYEEAGVRWVHVEGEWTTAPASGGPPGSWFDETHVFRRAYLNQRIAAVMGVPAEFLDRSEPLAPPVDEPVEPDPDDAERVEFVPAPEDGDTQSWGGADTKIDARPWWRRYLPGGAR